MLCFDDTNIWVIAPRASAPTVGWPVGHEESGMLQEVETLQVGPRGSCQLLPEQVFLTHSRALLAGVYMPVITLFPSFMLRLPTLVRRLLVWLQTRHGLAWTVSLAFPPRYDTGIAITMIPRSIRHQATRKERAS